MGPVTMICSPSAGSFCSNATDDVGSVSLGGGLLLAVGAHDLGAASGLTKNEFSTSMTGECTSIGSLITGVGNRSSRISGDGSSKLSVQLLTNLFPLSIEFSFHERILRRRGFSSGLIFCSMFVFSSSWHFFVSNFRAHYFKKIIKYRYFIKLKNKKKYEKNL